MDTPAPSPRGNDAGERPGGSLSNDRLERLTWRFDAGQAGAPFAPVLVGVVGSGNVEVLLEPVSEPACVVDVETSARGFGAIWSALLEDFHRRHGLGGVRISMHDMGATPAVVGLRLEQAVLDMKEQLG